MSLGHSGISEEKIKEVLKRKETVIFFVGIGGVSMSRIAMLLRSKGYRVVGSDRERSCASESLTRTGIPVIYGHTGEGIDKYSPELVVYSLSVSEYSPELLEAKRRGIACVSRAELLGAILTLYKVPIGVCGSHGKTTVTAMLGSIFAKAGKAHTLMVGAPYKWQKENAFDGDDYIIYEACEYKDSFLRFKPFCQILLNLELDHTDYFKSLDQIKDSFFKAANLADGFAVICADDENLNSILGDITPRRVTFGANDGADYKYSISKREGGIYSFSLTRYGEFYSDFSLPLIGEYNVMNATAAIAAAAEVGIDKNDIRNALASFRAVERRLELVSYHKGVPVYYDYAHHPTEIKATLDALHAEGYKDIVAVFCPHTYSRTAALWNEFCQSLSLAESVVITDIYAARENPIDGISAERLAADIPHGIYLPQTEIFDYIKNKSCDVIALMGAGNLDITLNSFIKAWEK